MGRTHGSDRDPEPIERRFAVGLVHMSENFRARAALIAPLVASGLLAAGCVSSPTYGTDKTANEQLASDLSGMFSVKPKRVAASDYKPRPELVKPTKGSTELPAPQENIVTASADVWPESPEQQRARIRANATANRDNPNFEPEVVNDISVGAQSGTSAARGNLGRAGDAGIIDPQASKKAAQDYKRRLAESQQGSPTVRKTLTEPPLEYRVPAETAAADEIGEDEVKKARRLKKQATGGKTWRDFVPWL